MYAMSKKRTAAESNNDDDEQTNTTSEALYQRDGNAKRTKLNDTVLQDLPYELLECILIEAVVLEVKALKLVKGVWKEKAGLVMNRLGDVCSQWTSILTTNYFRKKLHRILDDTAQTIRLEVLHQTTISPPFEATATLNDEIFLLRTQGARCYDIHVYNRNDMEHVKDIIPLPRAKRVRMTACKVLNCVFVIVRQMDSTFSVSRISKESDIEPKFKLSPCENNHRRPIDLIRISANGSLLILSAKDGRDSSVVSIYNANGFLHREIILPLDGRGVGLGYHDLLLRSNGNLVVACLHNSTFRTELKEINESGCIERQYVSLRHDYGKSYVDFADACGRIMISNSVEEIELLDSEFNLLGLYSLQQDADKSPVVCIFDLHYDSERNEIAYGRRGTNNDTKVLTSIRFTDE